MWIETGPAEGRRPTQNHLIKQERRIKKEARELVWSTVLLQKLFTKVDNNRQYPQDVIVTQDSILRGGL